MSKAKAQNTAATVRRLLGFALVYKHRLIIGMLAGMIVGGSIFSMLAVMRDVIGPFQVYVNPVRPEQAEGTQSPEPSAEGNRKQSSEERLLADVARRLSIPLAEKDGGISWQFVALILAAGMLSVTAKSVGTFVNRYYMRWVGARVVMDLRNQLFRSLQKQSLSYYGRSDVGKLISRCTYDTTIVETIVSRTAADLVRAPCEIAGAAAYVVLAAAREQVIGVVLLLVLMFPLLVYPVVFLGRYVKRYAGRALERISELVSRMQENFSGVRVVKAYNMEDAECERFEAMNRRYFRTVIKALRIELAMTPLMESVGFLCACGFLFFCYVKGVRLHQILPIGAAGVLAYRPVKQLAKLNVGIQRAAAAGERLFAILDADTSLPEAPDAVAVKAFSEKIVFDKVGFRYDDDGQDVLGGISLEIPRGHVVAFVGETGSGKTTVANLLARFYDPVDGSITLDGVDLRQIEVKSLRSLIGIVTQETILFNDSIANNIGYGTEGASREQIIAAAKRANAHDFIIAEEGGYDRGVGEKGCLLSGGQRQRIAIARAILKNPPILILDEATSSLDTVTEQLVQEAINRVMADRTVFAIAHRLSTIRHADQIFVLEQGHIIERGTHDELYAAEGAYRRLSEMQFA